MTLNRRSTQIATDLVRRCCAVLLAAAWLSACKAAIPVSQDGPSASETGPPIFEDWSDPAGLDFVHFNGMAGKRLIVEIMGSGAAWLDYDRDGDLDAYLLQGRPLTASDPAAQIESAPFDQLFRNELISATEGNSTQLEFRNVTAESRLRADGYGMAAAVGDIDNDGWPDLYVANFGADQLWRNNGDGSFSELAEAAGIRADGWSSAASFFDYNQDGWQDLYVVGYLEIDLDHPVDCYSEKTGDLDYCSPGSFRPEPDRLFRNLGRGRFVDVTAETGISSMTGHGLGLATADFNQDGLVDVYVANDGDENQLWMNQGGERFNNAGPVSGSAVDMAGNTQASMGVSVDDFDADGDVDIFVTHLSNETNTLYVNDGQGFFKDATRGFEIGGPSLRMTAFGVTSLDLENDGWLDLAIANGAVTVIYDQHVRGDPLPLKMTNQAFRNLEGKRFEEITATAGPAFEEEGVYRGMVPGDVDNDGDLDLLLTRNNGRALLLLNRLGQDSAWIGLRLLASEQSFDQVGAKLVLRHGSDRDRYGWSRSDGGYGSARDPRVLFGLGSDQKAQTVDVYWPDGTAERWSDLQTGRYHTLVRGGGTAEVRP